MLDSHSLIGKVVSCFSHCWPKFLSISFLISLFLSILVWIAWQFPLPSSKRFSGWLFSLSWIPLNNCTSPDIFYVPCNVSGLTEHLLLVDRDHVLYSSPLLDFLILDVIMQIYPRQESLVYHKIRILLSKMEPDIYSEKWKNAYS